MSKFYKEPKFYVIIAMIVGSLLRLSQLSRQSFWMDELYTVTDSMGPDGFGNFSFFLNQLTTDVHPPLYQLFMYGWFSLVGNNEFTARLPSAIAGVLSLIAMYYFTHRYFDRYIASSATILLSLTYIGIFYSQEARPYSMFILFTILSTNYFLKLLSDNNPTIKDCMIYTVIGIITAYLHYFGLLLMICQLTYLLIATFIFKGKYMLRIALIQVAIGLSYFPWVYIMTRSINNARDYGFWIKVPGFEFIGGTLALLFYPERLLLLIAIVFFVLVPITALDTKILKQRIAQLFKDKNYKSPTLVVAYLFTSVLAISYTFSVLVTPVLTYRNITSVAVFFYVLIAVFIHTKHSTIKQTGFIFVATLLFITLLLPGYYSPSKEQWRESALYAVDHYDNKTIYVGLKYVEFFEYYMNKTNIPKDYIMLRKEDNDSISDIYSQAIKLNKSKMIVLGSHDMNLTDDDLSYLQNKSVSYDMKQFVAAKAYMFNLK